jgi:hypothetical protein
MQRGVVNNLKVDGLEQIELYAFVEELPVKGISST